MVQRDNLFAIQILFYFLDTTPLSVTESSNPEPETTPNTFNVTSTTELTTVSGRAKSRFKDLGDLRELFAKRRNASLTGDKPSRAFESILTSTQPSDESSTRRSFFANKFRSKSPPAVTQETTFETTTSSFLRKRPPLINRFRGSDSTTAGPEPLETPAPGEIFLCEINS